MKTFDSRVSRSFSLLHAICTRAIFTRVVVGTKSDNFASVSGGNTPPTCLERVRQRARGARKRGWLLLFKNKSTSRVCDAHKFQTWLKIRELLMTTWKVSTRNELCKQLWKHRLSLVGDRITIGVSLKSRLDNLFFLIRSW